MDKINDYIKNKSIKTSFMIYIVTCLLAALILSCTSFAICQWGQSSIYEKYKHEIRSPENSDKFIADNIMSDIGTLYISTSDIRNLYTDSHRAIDNLLGVLTIALIPVWFIVCIGIASVLFYRRKLQKPITILNHAADNMANNNLNFEIIPMQNDELGKLCVSFEKMRVALQNNNLEMWRTMEERRLLNAAFAHDLRTPLTVLKGQSEMILKYVPDGKMPMGKVITTAETMKKHITRLENYVTTMNDLQRLEDIEIKKCRISNDDLKAQIHDGGKIICGDLVFIFESYDLKAESIDLDLSVVMRVCENLLSNAVRYANKKITVSLDFTSRFSITVSDDGEGFSPKDLINATKPFYKSENKTGDKHFGLGLNICKILCEKHGGRLELSNGKVGAIVKAIF